MQGETEPRRARIGRKTRAALAAGLRVTPWLVFGPITGMMSEAAVFNFKKGRRLLGAFYVALNLGVLIGLPLLTAAIAHRL